MGRCVRPLLILVLTVCVLTGLSHPDAQGQTREILSVEASDQQHLILSVTDLETAWRTHTLRQGSVILQEPAVRGFVNMSEPGEPLVPRLGGWIVVPPGMQPRLKVLQEDWQSAGARPLMLTALPIPVGDPEDGLSSLSEILVLPGETPPVHLGIDPEDLRRLTAGASPRQGPALSLGQVAQWRGRNIVAVTLVPLHHNARSEATEVLRSGRWEIEFVPETPGKSLALPEGPAKITRRGDTRFGQVFLNPDLLRDAPTEAAWRGLDRAAKDLPPAVSEKRGGKSGTLLGSETRLAVDVTQMFRVTYARLRDRGQLPDVPIDEDQIRVYQRRYLPELDDGTGAPYLEVEVPILMVGEGDAFDGDDYFIFYGLRPRDDEAYTLDQGDGPVSVPGAGDPFERNNQFNWYWLAASEPDAGDAWARMAVQTVDASQGTPLTSYRREEHHEEQLAFRENIPSMSQDALQYKGHKAEEVIVGFPLWNPAPDGGPVNVDVALALFDASNRRHLKLTLVTDNTLTTILDDDYYLNSINQIVPTYAAPASAIAGDNARVVLTGAGTAEGRALYCWLNWVEIAYDAAYAALGDQLIFHGGAGSGTRNIEVTGFSNNDLGLIEITNPRQPVFHQLAAGNIVDAGASWTLSLAPQQSGTTRYFFATADMTDGGVNEYTFFRSEVVLDPVDPTDPSGSDPDLVVVCHPEFRSALQRWLDHRRARSGGDLEYHVVAPQDLYDWYSGGMHDPWALKRFTNHAISQWGAWALTLVGDANENARMIGVSTDGEPWARDLVPTHLHRQQTFQYKPEQLASDKWYATPSSGTNYPSDGYPLDTYVPTDMYVGRMPCNSVAELNTHINKIVTMESVLPGQVWRKRGIFFADDDWSEHTHPDSALNWLQNKGNEEVFADSERDSLAMWWNTGTEAGLVADLLLLGDWLDEYPNTLPGLRRSRDFRENAEEGAVPALISSMNQGGLVAHYQGHANAYVLCSEYWIMDRPFTENRTDIMSLTNSSAPWFFMGLGCHISDWAQTTTRTGVVPNEQSLGEKMLVRTAGGASASYASSGYEYIDLNAWFGEVILKRWLFEPPTMRVDSADEHRSRWVLGEMMWASEADALSVSSGTRTREMAAQYTLLGDPLMVLDAGPPEVTARVGGGEVIEGEYELVAVDATNLRVVDLAARDEAGISRIRVTDSTGADLTEQIVTEATPPDAVSHQVVDYTLNVPTRPFDHSLDVKVYDTAGVLDTDTHYELTLNLPLTAVFTVDDQIVEEGTFVFETDVPVDFSAAVNCAAWLTEDQEMSLAGENVTVRDVSFVLGRDNGMTMTFTAEVLEGQSGDRSVILNIDGFETSFMLEGSGQSGGEVNISKLVNYPNPVREETRFIFETAAPAGSGRVLIYSVAGHMVADLDFAFGGTGSEVVDWDGRDNDGDKLANGVYLYRVELETANGRLASDMQRLVVMR